MALNAILVSDELLGHSTILTHNKKKNRTEMLDEMSNVYTAFEYLRKMVRAFIDDIDNKSR
jgi:hypothetical protein